MLNAIDPTVLNILFLGLGGLISAAVSSFISLRAAARAAKVEDIDNLKKGYTNLQGSYKTLEESYTRENERLGKANEALEANAARLRGQIDTLFTQAGEQGAGMIAMRQENSVLKQSLADNRASCESQISSLQKQVEQLVGKLPNPDLSKAAAPVAPAAPPQSDKLAEATSRVADATSLVAEATDRVADATVLAAEKLKESK